MLLFSEILNINAVIWPMIIFMIGACIIFPASLIGALQLFSKNAGCAGAMLEGLQNLGTCLCSLVLSYRPKYNQLPLGLILIGLALLSILTFFIIFYCYFVGSSSYGQ